MRLIRCTIGPQISHEARINHDLGGNAAWAPADIASDLADGSGAVPVQLMWSNKHDAPATRIA
jgi:hypothetical protein